MAANEGEYRVPPKDRREGPGRRSELVQIAYRHIAERGFEGLRVHDVAMEAGINNATLHYYFPTKEALIHGVVAYLMKEFSTLHASRTAGTPGDALDELRAEFEDTAYRLHHNPEQVVVYTELLIRSLREPAVAGAFAGLERDWHAHLVELIERGMRQGVFRTDMDPAAAADVIMAQTKGLGLQMLGQPDPGAIDHLVAEIAGQVERRLAAPGKQQDANASASNKTL